MNLKKITKNKGLTENPYFLRIKKISILSYQIFRAALATLLVFYFSLIISSNPVNPNQSAQIEKAISILEERGFTREVTLLRNTVLFRNTDNWLNSLIEKENAFASTNCPFGIMTIYPDFYSRTKDDTERAMILLHEVRHLQGGDEHDAYSYVWLNRNQLGWTILSHGTTETFVTIELQTRENVPELFNCPANLWNDCTEILRAGK